MQNKPFALITGASSGIGAATAKAIAVAYPELHLFLLARREERLQQLAQEIGPARTQYAALDIRDRAQVQDFISRHQHINFQMLINNAGLAAGLDNFQTASLDDWEAMIDTNIKGLLYMTRGILPGMMARGTGHIVNLGSIAGHLVYPKGHVYNATKFAVRALNEALRIDTLGSGVRVTSIDPGMVETEFSLVRFKGDAKMAEDVYKGMRPLKPEDVAEAILWSLQRPQHVNVQEILLMPTDQASPRDVFRK